MDSNLLAVVALIVVALVFDFINGFHDAANSIATVVSTRVLSPGQGGHLGGVLQLRRRVHLRDRGRQDGRRRAGRHHRSSRFAVIFAGLIGAIIWDLITWYFGLPTSSSHALIGGYAGAAVTKAGWSAIIVSGWTKTLVFIVLAPLIGMALGFALMVAILWIFQATPPGRVDQLVPPAAAGLGGGLQPRPRRQRRAEDDGHHRRRAGRGRLPRRSTTGICRSRCGSSSRRTRRSRSARCRAAGGSSRRWDRRSPSCTPVGGFAAETAGAISLFTATHLGIPVSTTHTITGAIVGVGSIKRLSAVRWGVAGRIVWAWILTIPASAFIAAVTYWITAHAIAP